MSRTLVTGPPAPPRERHTLRLDGRLVLEPGREVTVTRIGRCSFTGEVNADGSLNVYDAAHRCRSVMPERVTKVHRTIKLREAKP